MLHRFLPYGRQYIDEIDREAVYTSLQEDIITRGSHVSDFEKALTEYTGAKYCVCFSSGSQALHAVYQAIDCTVHDHIFSSPNSFIATVAHALQLGAKVSFIDIDKTSGNMQLDRLKEALCQPRSRGRSIVVPVHFSGIAQDVEKIHKMMRDPNGVIIEDAAHALGSTYPNSDIKVGSCAFSDMTILSFHPVKNITTGEGGAVTTNSEQYYKRLKRIRDSGIERSSEMHECPEQGPWYYEVQELSTNSHMTDMQAILGQSQLKKLDMFTQKRRELVKVYRKLLQGIEGIELFSEKFDLFTAYHLFVVQINFEKFGISRADCMQKLREKNVGSQVHYIPLYKHPAVRKRMYIAADTCPIMDIYYQQALSLPLFYSLQESEIESVCTILKQALGIA